MDIALAVGFSYMVTHVARAEIQTPHLGTPHENVTLKTSDGLHLKGWYIPSRNGAAVIAFPGRKGPQAQARMLAENGYGVLLFDRRGEGASDGDGNMYGWGGTRDIDAAVDFLKKRADVDPGRIGGIGLSVGGELMLEAAADNPDLAAVVSEGAGTRTLVEEIDDFSGSMLVRGLHSMVVKHATVALFDNQLPPESLTDLTPRITQPTLIIWAPNGGNREEMSPKYARLIGPSADVWRIDDAKHIKGLQTHPQEYERRVVGFFDQALPEVS
jgi:pimeloyl-ACP methyl ester carboxylesterase